MAGVKKSHDTCFNISDNYNIQIQLMDNESIIAIAEETITKVKYKTIKTKNEILDLTEKATYIMNPDMFYKTIIAGFDANYSDIDYYVQIKEDEMSMTFYLKINLIYTYDEKEYVLILDKVNQTEIKETKKISDDKLDRLIDECAELKQLSIINGKMMKSLCEDVSHIKAQVEVELKEPSTCEQQCHIKDQVEDIRATKCVGYFELDAHKQQLELIQIELLKRFEANEKSMKQLNDKLVDSITSQENENNNLRTALSVSEQRIITLEEKLANRDEQITMMEVQQIRIAGYWFCDTKYNYSEMPIIKMNINKKYPNSSLIINGYLNVSDGYYATQIWIYGNSKYYNNANEGKIGKANIILCDFVIRNNDFVGTQCLKLLFSSAPFAVLNPYISKPVSPVGPNSPVAPLSPIGPTQSFIQVTEVII